MTRLTFFKNGNDYLGFCCKDHSGYAASGYDIVCAAVSTAVQITASYLEKYHSNNLEIIVDEQKALITIKCKNAFDEANRQISILEEFSHQLKAQYSDYFTFDYLEV